MPFKKAHHMGIGGSIMITETSGSRRKVTMLRNKLKVSFRRFTLQHKLFPLEVSLLAIHEVSQPDNDPAMGR